MSYASAITLDANIRRQYYGNGTMSTCFWKNIDNKQSYFEWEVIANP
jgi:hypothetical protein